MPQPDERALLFDIKLASARVLELIARMDSGSLQDDWMIEASLVRQFTIVGEAVKLIPPTVRESRPEVDWSSWARFRDFLVHAYWRTDRERLLEIARNEVPDLLKAVDKMLTDANS